MLYSSFYNFTASLPLNQAFENDYPKLIQVFSGLLSQVEKLHDESDQHSNSMASFLYSQSTPETQTSHQRQELLLKALSQFEKIYISRLFSRLSDSVNQLFVNNSLPKQDELVAFVRLLARFAYYQREGGEREGGERGRELGK